MGVGMKVATSKIPVKLHQRGVSCVCVCVHVCFFYIRRFHIFISFFPLLLPLHLLLLCQYNLFVRCVFVCVCVSHWLLCHGRVIARCLMRRATQDSSPFSSYCTYDASLHTATPSQTLTHTPLIFLCADEVLDDELPQFWSTRKIFTLRNLGGWNKSNIGGSDGDKTPELISFFSNNLSCSLNQTRSDSNNSQVLPYAN